MTKHETIKRGLNNSGAVQTKSRKHAQIVRKEIKRKTTPWPRDRVTRHTHGVTTHLQRQATRVKGDVEVGRGFEAYAAKVDVVNEVLRSAGEELVGGCEAPGDAADVGVPVRGGAGDSGPGKAAAGAVEDQMVEGVGGPAARTRELVQGDVGPEAGRVVRREGVANREPECGGGGVP